MITICNFYLVVTLSLFDSTRGLTNQLIVEFFIQQTEDEGGKLLNHIYPNQHQLVTRRPPIKEKTNPRKFHIPDPKNDSSAVGELLRGTAVPYDEIYKRGRRKVELNLSPPDGFKSGYTGE